MYYEIISIVINQSILFHKFILNLQYIVDEPAKDCNKEYNYKHSGQQLSSLVIRCWKLPMLLLEISSTKLNMPICKPSTLEQEYTVWIEKLGVHSSETTTFCQYRTFFRDAEKILMKKVNFWVKHIFSALEFDLSNSLLLDHIIKLK